MSANCLLCDTPLTFQVGWLNAFGMQKEGCLCLKCSNELDEINGEICSICGRPFALLDSSFRFENECYDCARWEQDEYWRGVLLKNRSIYSYNSFLKEIMARFKFRSDAELVKIFQQPLQKVFQKEFPKHLLVPIPLSGERKYERAFNQAELIAELLRKPILALIKVTNEEKQSKKNRIERLESKSPIFKFDPNFKQQTQSADILIIDDIYTTGATIRHAAKELLTNEAKSVSSLTIARG
ncbi:ComF family protein [Bacillus sp. FJAT-45350]|uniref:ComF family protein n=1 Tax=Bacillus sp. FJAT-45350 TaxID=2011014 RepID=UPI000BB9312C|nr:ComF family protein [Bacillus sp. FJAT-45350]